MIYSSCRKISVLLVIVTLRYEDLFDGNSVEIHHRLPLRDCVSYLIFEKPTSTQKRIMCLLHKHCPFTQILRLTGVLWLRPRGAAKALRACFAKTRVVRRTTSRRALAPGAQSASAGVRKGKITECAATPLRAVGFAHGGLWRARSLRDRPHLFYDFYHRRAVYFARGSYVFGAGEK